MVRTNRYDHGSWSIWRRMAVSHVVKHKKAPNIHTTFEQRILFRSIHKDERPNMAGYCVFGICTQVMSDIIITSTGRSFFKLTTQF